MKKSLLKAVTKNDVKTVNKLVKEGVDLDETDEYTRTALHYAMESRSNEKNRELIDVLLSKTKDINAEDADLYTPLHVALENSNMHGIKQLAKHGAELKSDERESIFEVAALHKSTRTFQSILDAFDSQISDKRLLDILCCSILCQNAKCVAIVLAHRPEVVKRATTDIKTCRRIWNQTVAVEGIFIAPLLIKAGFYIEDAPHEPFDSLFCLLVEGGCVKISGKELRQRKLCCYSAPVARFICSRGLKPFSHKCQERMERMFGPCFFQRLNPTVLSLQRISANVIRNTIIEIQGKSQRKRCPFKSLYSTVQDADIPKILQEYLVNLQISENDDDDNDDNDDDEKDTFDVFPVTEDSEQSNTSDDDDSIESGLTNTELEESEGQKSDGTDSTSEDE